MWKILIIASSFKLKIGKFEIGNWDFLQDFIYQNLENCKNSSKGSIHRKAEHTFQIFNKKPI